MKAIMQVGILGESARGDNGAVLVDKESSEMVYLLSHEFDPPQFREQLNDLLSDDNHQHIFVVFKDKDAMHINKIPKGTL